MLEKIIIAGAGGQGIMLLGRVLVEAAAKEDRYITWLPCYGAEVRGGAAYCMVVLSDEEIASPCFDKADTLIAMNKPSFERFKDRIVNKGLLIINTSLIDAPININKNICILKYPFTDIAVKLGNVKVTNMVALGCYINKRKVVDMNKMFRVIEEIAPSDKKGLIKINKQAILSGAELK